MISNPFEQFQIQNHFELSYLNSMFLITNTIVVCFFIIILFKCMHLVLSFRIKKFTQSILLSLFKSLYNFIYNLVNSYLPFEGRIYFPFFLYLFIFICINNLIGILPYSFTTTSHLSITFTLSFIVWYGCVIIGFSENGLRFFSVFLPRGIPFVLVPFLVGIELISYIFRSVSLALRLFANIVAGHILLDTLAIFIHKMLFPSMITFVKIIISIIPYIMCIVLILFECVVALLQGYIFVVLSSIYLKDTYSAQSH